ncbi:MAG TPA: PepSY-associated TM helix domain-containing protein [Methylosinus sp.]|jgi:uncharacterized iron-regulated membrane protein|uniref:PepSY-associated TM helix domain-containing protein n=1 Tax=Methylosinus sp. TaxID=427 RepID=UPI002F9531FE
MRAFWVWLHRWTGLLMTGFLVVVGLTGSILAFHNELDRLATPWLYATPQDAPPLDFAALAEKAEALVPQGRVRNIGYRFPEQVIVGMTPRKDAATGKPYELGFRQLFLDPWTGDELGRRTPGDLSQGRINLMTFIYLLHDALMLGPTGITILGVVALVWTLDCFVGFYLTLPIARSAFWRRWKPAWLIKSRASAYRVNFDLHRASGLWLWPVLLVFAWSSVMFDWRPLYDGVMHAFFQYEAPREALEALRARPTPHHRLDWRAAQATGEALMAKEAADRGFTVTQARAMTYLIDKGVYILSFRSSLDVDAIHAGNCSVYFDGDSGALLRVMLPTGQYAGNTITSWLYALHMGGVFGLPYRIFVCALGLIVAMLSATGVYIWSKKRRARRLGARHSRFADEREPRTDRQHSLP